MHPSILQRNICLFRNFIVSSIIVTNKRHIYLRYVRRLFESRAYLKVRWKSAALNRSNRYLCKYNIDQYLIVLNLYCVSMNKILVSEFMTVKFSQNLNSNTKFWSFWKYKKERLLLAVGTYLILTSI